MENIRKVLNQSTEKVKNCISEIIQSLEKRMPAKKEPERSSVVRETRDVETLPDPTTRQYRSETNITLSSRSDSSGPTRKHSKEDDTIAKLQLTQKLATLEQKKNCLEELLFTNQNLITKIEEKQTLTAEDMIDLTGCIINWMKVRDESDIKEKRQKEDEKRQSREREEAERKKREEEERKRSEKEKRKKREEKERRKQAEERKRKEEEERKRKRKSGEDKMRRKAEEDMKKREDERRRPEEEEKKKIEAERKRKLEIQRAEEEKRRKEEQRKQKEEEERKRQEEERRRMEEERCRQQEKIKTEEEERKRRLDTNNWNAISYLRNAGEVDGARQGLCCLVSAIQGQLTEDDLECLASDEDRDIDTSLIHGDKPASSMIHVSSKSGRKNLEAPMRVFVPYSQVDSDEEIVVKCSIDGSDWVESEPIHQFGVAKEFKNLSLVAAEINHCEEAKIIVVSRIKSENTIVYKQGLVYPSTTDKKVKFVFPRDTFGGPTKVYFQVRQIQPGHLNLATQQYETCENVLSTSSLVMLSCDEVTNMDIDIDIARTQNNNSHTEKGRFHHVYRGRDNQWHFADSGIKNRNQGVTVSLPRGRESYSVLEIEARKEVPRETVLLAAEDIFCHVQKSVVRLLAKQKVDNPSSIMIQCLRRDYVDSRLAELFRLGYSVGPDTSREFCLLDGEKVYLRCKGNIEISSRSHTNVACLVYHDYMDSAKQEASLFVVDKTKQRDYDAYLGKLLFETADHERQKIKGDLPISLPKVRQPRPRTARARLQLQPHPLCKYLAWKLTEDDNDLWMEVMNHLGAKTKMDAIYRRAKTLVENEDKRNICQTVFENWMKSLPMENDKVQLVLDALAKSNCKGLINDCKQFVSIHKVLFAEEVLSELSKCTTEDLDTVAAKLKVSSEITEQCRSKPEDQQISQILSKWQQTDSVICSVPEDCLDKIESVCGSSKLVKDIRLKLQHEAMKR